MNKSPIGLNITKNTTVNKCGECSMCCHHPRGAGKVWAALHETSNPLWVPVALKKPFEWCTHCSTHKSCDIYEDRPPQCIHFECMYLENKDMGEEWYPKNAGFYMKGYNISTSHKNDVRIKLLPDGVPENADVAVIFIVIEQKNEHIVYNVEPYKSFFDEKIKKHHWFIYLVTEKGTRAYSQTHKSKRISPNA